MRTEPALLPSHPRPEMKVSGSFSLNYTECCFNCIQEKSFCTIPELRLSHLSLIVWGLLMAEALQQHCQRGPTLPSTLPPIPGSTISFLAWPQCLGSKFLTPFTIWMGMQSSHQKKQQTESLTDLNSSGKSAKGNVPPPTDPSAHRYPDRQPTKHQSRQALSFPPTPSPVYSLWAVSLFRNNSA